jgi:Flp pilus assembly protein CpaB
MRASTVFALALALLIGLAAAAGAKYAGLFDKKAGPPAAEKPAPVKVLVAGMTLYEDYAVTGDQVIVREFAEEDLRTAYGPNWREKLLPAMPSAAHLRIAKRTIAADTPLLREFFADHMLPDELSKRLEPNTRAVNVEVPKSRAAGGALRVGEYVDVLLTTEIGYGKEKEMRTACIARSCKIIMKRNSPWPVITVDPDDKPLNFTLQANVYRANLIDFAGQHGQLSLLPSPTPIKTPGTWNDPTSKEYATEDQRVEQVIQGALNIGDKDLLRIFGVTPPVRTVTPPPTVIQHLAGVKDAGYTVIPHGGFSYFPTPPAGPSGDGQPAGGIGAASSNGDTQPAGYTFKLPSATGNSGCKTCDDAKKRAGQQ